MITLEVKNKIDNDMFGMSLYEKKIYSTTYQKELDSMKDRRYANDIAKYLNSKMSEKLVLNVSRTYLEYLIEELNKDGYNSKQRVQNALKEILEGKER